MDVTKAYKLLNWQAKLSFCEAIEFTVDWYKRALVESDMFDFCKEQISAHQKINAQSQNVVLGANRGFPPHTT
ncbi:MAG: hypothetical protein ACLUKN_06615 [Bacilli bacterium]